MGPKQFVALTRRYRDRLYREDRRAALIASIIAETSRDPKKRKKPFKPEDFLGGRKPRTKKQTWQEQLRLVEQLNAMYGGEDKRPHA